MYQVFCFCADHLLVKALHSDVKLSRLTFLVVVLSLSIHFHVKAVLLGLRGMGSANPSHLLL